MTATKHVWPYCFIPTLSMAPLSQSMNSTTAAVGSVYRARKSGTINRILIHCLGVTGVSPQYTVGVETVTADDSQNPTGIQFGTSQRVICTPVASTTSVLTLPDPAVVTAGQFYAVTVRYSSGTVNTSNFANLGHGSNSLTPSLGAAFARRSISGSWLTGGANTWGYLVAQYDDDSYESFCLISTLFDAQSFRSSVMTDYGTRFESPMNGFLYGFFINTQRAGAATAKLMTLDGTVLQSVPIPAGGSTAAYYTMEPTPIDEGVEYRLVMSADTDIHQQVNQMHMHDIALREQIFGTAYFTKRIAGVWTDSPLSAPQLSPLIGIREFSGGAASGFPMSRILNRV